MVASTGRTLLDEGCVDAYRLRLLPHALIVTPNLWEAALLAGVPSPTSGTWTPWPRWPGTSTGSARHGCWSRGDTSPA